MHEEIDIDSGDYDPSDYMVRFEVEEMYCACQGCGHFDYTDNSGQEKYAILDSETKLCKDCWIEHQREEAEHCCGGCNSCKGTAW